jgi:hypothetical protein
MEGDERTGSLICRRRRGVGLLRFRHHWHRACMLQLPIAHRSLGLGIYTQDKSAQLVRGSIRQAHAAGDGLLVVFSSMAISGLNDK